MKARYLTFYSYVGTPFRSSEKIWIKGGRNHPDPLSVQGLMEIGLLKFKSLNYPTVTLSSRTDGGVHALNNAAHFDLERYGKNIYNPDDIKYTLNKTFYNNSTSISIRKCIRVSDNFNARFLAKSRTYLYRLAVLKPEVTLEGKNISTIAPIEEWKRCHHLRLQHFNIDLFKQGAQYLVGYHDFSTFKKFDKQNTIKSNRRTLYSIDVSPGRPLVTSHTEEKEALFDYWDIKFHGRSFVHNQIRRMIGVLISVAIGKLLPEEIKVLLQVPSKNSWPSFACSTPPDGLYLCDVEYDPQDLIYDPEVKADDAIQKDWVEELDSIED